MPSPLLYSPYLLNSGPARAEFTLPPANIVNGKYRYTEDLLKLEAMAPPQPVANWPQYVSPIKIDYLSPFLNSHPDQAFATYIRHGLHDGFHIGFNYQLVQPQCRGGNHMSARAQPHIIREKLSAELQAGRLLGPIPARLTHSIHTSYMGLVPKAHQPNKFRLIVNLSYPAGTSINDGISQDLCSLTYASVDDAVQLIRNLGRDTLMVKLDLKDAYRIVPVHPQDYHLLGIAWEGATYVDRALPFGLRSAPKIFNAVADTIAWVFHTCGIKHQLHYLDDYLFLGAPNSPEAAQALAIASELLKSLGIPVAVHKTEGPTTTLDFLGILIDTHNFQLRLPTDKLTRLQNSMQTWVHRRRCRRHELESFLGHLSHAATVVKQGRIFLRELFPLLSHTRNQYHFVHLNLCARADLLWWHVFLQEWNGSSFFLSAPPSIEVTSDASGSFGCGALSSYGWFQVQWPDSWQGISIAAKELVPVVIAAATWGRLWQRTCIRFRCDNMAVVSVLRSRTSRDRLLAHLLRCLTLYAATYRFDFVAEHIPGVHNSAADAISRNNLTLLSSLCPCSPQVQITQAVLDLLVVKRPEWGSPEWIHLWRSSLTSASPQPHTLSTGQAGADTPPSATPTLSTPSHFLNTPCANLPRQPPNRWVGEQSALT